MVFHEMRFTVQRHCFYFEDRSAMKSDFPEPPFSPTSERPNRIGDALTMLPRKNPEEIVFEPWRGGGFSSLRAIDINKCEKKRKRSACALLLIGKAAGNCVM